MTIFESSADRRCYTSVSWVSKEKSPARTRAQVLPNIAKQREHNEFQHTTQANPQHRFRWMWTTRKLGEKNSYLRSQKTRIEHSDSKRDYHHPRGGYSS
jgi:hypothetical protein